MDEIIINCDDGRIRTPLLVVKEGHLVFSRKHVDELKMGRLRFSDLVRNGVGEWTDAEEDEDSLLALYRYDARRCCKERRQLLSRHAPTRVNLGTRADGAE